MGSLPSLPSLVSPYLKSLSMVTCARLMHLMESFSTPWFLFAKPTNHYLVFYLLEILNNIIQYQFDGEWVWPSLMVSGCGLVTVRRCGVV